TYAQLIRTICRIIMQPTYATSQQVTPSDHSRTLQSQAAAGTQPLEWIWTHQDKCASSSPRWNTRKDRREENRDQKAYACRDGCQPCTSTLCNACAGLNKCCHRAGS